MSVRKREALITCRSLIPFSPDSLSRAASWDAACDDDDRRRKRGRKVEGRWRRSLVRRRQSKGRGVKVTKEPFFLLLLPLSREKARAREDTQMSPSKAHQARCVRLLRQRRESQAEFCKVSERKARDKETLATPASLFPLSSFFTSLSLQRKRGKESGSKGDQNNETQ